MANQRASCSSSWLIGAALFTLPESVMGCRSCFNATSLDKGIFYFQNKRPGKQLYAV
jgi:hypothetical protein